MFSSTSRYLPRLSQKHCNLDLIIDDDKSITVVLISHHNNQSNFVCPSIPELESVLNEKLIIGIQELFRFWSRNLSDIFEKLKSTETNQTCLDFLHHGIPVSTFLNFLSIHKFVLLEIIYKYCQGDHSISGIGNQFVEQVTFLSNEFINDAVNITMEFLKRQNVLEMSTEHSEIRRLLNILCKNGQLFRKLILDSRYSLHFHERISVQRFTNSVKKEKTHKVDIDRWKTMTKNEIITECLMNRQISAMKYYFQKHDNEKLSSIDILHQTKSLILSNVTKGSLDDVKVLIQKLGFEPIQTLTSICLETTDTQIRDDIYCNLRLELENTNYKIAKGLIDKLENMHRGVQKRDSFLSGSIDSNSDSNNPNLYDFVQPFLDRIDGGDYPDFETALIQSRNNKADNKPMKSVHVKLSWLMQYLENRDFTPGDSEVSKMVELSLIDADYKALLSPIIHNRKRCQTSLQIWLQKWKDCESLLVQYIVMSNNIDLIVAVLDLNLAMESGIVNRIIDTLIDIMRTEKNHFTLVDRTIAEIALEHLFVHHPDLFVKQLMLKYPNDISLPSEIMNRISPTIALHYMCSDLNCTLGKFKGRETALVSFNNNSKILDIISNRISGEFPILLYYLLDHSCDLPIDINSTPNYEIQSTIQFNSALKSNSKVLLFQSFLSQDVFNLDTRTYNMAELDEILYAALLSGISYQEIIESNNPVLDKVNSIFHYNDYWNKLKKRLLRPELGVHDTTNIEQYYEANVYNFLNRCGFPMALNNIFAWQPHNNFGIENRNSQFPTIGNIQMKHHSLFENSKYSLDYVYYLSHGRPFQAYMSLVYEFTESRKPNAISHEIIKEIVKGIHQIAFSNISNRLIISGCFCLLRLIGSSTEPLRCYLTLCDWIIDWYVMSNGIADLGSSTESELNNFDIRKFYEMKTGKFFKLCLSKDIKERRRSRERIMKQLEEMFLCKLNNNHYTQISEIIDSWSFVLFFCQLQGMEFSTVLLQYFAQKNEWLLFLCCAQIFGYTKDQVQQAINKFDDISIRQHMTYIASKVEDFCSYSIKPEDSIKSSRKVSASTMIKNFDNLSNSPGSKENIVNKIIKPKFNRAKLKSAAKDNLIELIFDCQIRKYSKNYSLIENKSTIESMQLNSMKLLAFSIVLNHPFLSVLAYCTELDKPDQSPEDVFANYLNCIGSFILSSFPKKILKEYWDKWNGTVKVEWSEDIIELVANAIQNRSTNVVADAFFVLQSEKFSLLSSFFSMISQSVDTWNPVQRDLYLADFIGKCTLLCKSNVFVRDKNRKKIMKDENLLTFNRLLEVSLLTAMKTVQKTFGSRFLRDLLDLLSSTTSGLHQFHVQQLFSFTDLNLGLLNEVFSVFYDYVDLDKDDNIGFQFEENKIPINVRSKEFMEFVEYLVSKITESAKISVQYTKSRLIANGMRLITSIDNAPGFASFYEKKEMLKNGLQCLQSRLKYTDLMSNRSLTDLVSMAFVGQNDRESIIHLCLKRENNDPKSGDVHFNSNSNPTTVLNHGITDSWRRLVIPEEWQEQILNISEASSNNNLEEISHVNCLLNERKWIEACSYMIENNVYIKDAVLILISMNVACGKTDPNKLPSYLKGAGKTNQFGRIEKDINLKMPVRRFTSIFNSATRRNSSTSLEFDSSNNRSNRSNSRNADLCEKYLRNTLDVVIHGQEIVEYIYTIYCVANIMTESYLTVAKEEEFNVFTKILVGACKEKIDTADMYLGVVDIDPDKLSRFLAEVIVQVLRSELRTHIASTIGVSNISISSPQTGSQEKSLPYSGNSTSVFFSISPKNHQSQKPSPNVLVQRNSNTNFNTDFNSPLHEYVLKVAQRCQLRPEFNTTSPSKQYQESKLMKAFYLQDLLILTSSFRKLGKILYEYYQLFSQEVFSCKEDAEFLVLMLIQCHNCFTEAGDTVGISRCLKSAKDLSKVLSANYYFTLMAQLLCRIGRYGEMPYVFTALIENDHFELLLRKDMDKEGVIVPYLLDYLSRYLSDDFEKIELVCHKYNCYYELAETQTKKARSLFKNLRKQAWKNYGKDNVKVALSTIISNLLESCKNYFKVGCFKKVYENLRKAQFYKLQQKWIEDPSKTFTTGSFGTPLGKSLKLNSSKSTFPGTGFTGGVRIIDMNSEEAIQFLKRIPNFYTAFIVIDQLELSAENWIEVIVHHVLINGDDNYMQHYRKYFGRNLSSNFVQQCINRWEKLTVQTANKQNQNLKSLLSYCDDVFLVKRLSDKYLTTK